MFLSLSLSTLVLAQLVGAVLPDGRMHGNMMPRPFLPKVPSDPSQHPVTSRNGTDLPPYNTTYEFDQLIDHNNPSLGTFKQRFWHTYEFYEPGGPIILMTPGEANAQGYFTYLTNSTINGQIAQQQNASVVILEHRFFGFSNPRPDLTVESLKLLTLQQAIDDLVYFAQNVNLPMPGGDNVGPDAAPWILTGGSYSGALTSWTMVNQTGVFWAGYASSAVVEAILDFWEYFEPVRLNMPQNCSADVQAVIAHIDEVFTGTNQTAIQAIKNNFGLGDMTHLDDVAGALRNNLFDWQSLQVYSGPGTQFYEFCDALEVKNGQVAPESGWGLDHALDAWGTYWRETYLKELCGGLDPEDCLGTHDGTQSYYTDTEVDNANRSWFWMVCNFVGYLQEGAPEGHPSIVTRLVQPPYDLRQCKMMFPAAFPDTVNVQVNQTNELYKGWDVRLDRLFFANGMRDPWKDATVSATGVEVPSTDSQPIAVGDGFHCSDLLTRSGTVDATVRAVQTEALGFMKKWLASWKPQNKGKGTSAPRSVPVSTSQTLKEHAVKPINAFNGGVGSKK
ncbi:putative serine protease K12H4.7 [Termitomyces sp. T112]|nr:putative serine protease K12H4.7 [Termitomyces sp. T112]